MLYPGWYFQTKPGDPENTDSFLVYPDIEDMYKIETNVSEWNLEYKKDYALSQVLELVKTGQIPSKEKRRGLPVRTNQLLWWFRYLYID